MNHSLYVRGRFCSNQLMNLLVIVPLLFAALFAYQASNFFELTAGTSRINAVARTAYVTVDRQNANKKHFLPPINVLPGAIAHARKLIYSLSITLRSALSTSIPQSLRNLFLFPIKYTSLFVG
ncbi:hypothetical protein L1N85_10585 [Paenibacillus alkaliterrae]|uniref:hypothetical protein n=1 Tax=Paenibacillus alkaliterrae TaxID=320909 RepID=UPI001F1D42FC|nr:hypothetical protein [Paenibacillus alkaliterrae]MCF2938883.1 hypothetical protein [Paenibacillus alkaliterrae]